MSGRRKSQRLLNIVTLKSEPTATAVQVEDSVMAEVEITSSPPAVLSSQQTLKRPRDGDEVAVDEPPSKARQTHVKHETHWALDGNLLLQFGNVRFKVHRSRLCAQSKLIQAMIDTSNGSPNKEFRWQEDVEKLVENKEVVDGLDCFFFEDPSAEQFAALLDCMDSSIEYIYKPLPDLETIKRVLEAANYFVMRRYEDFATQYIIDLFPLKADSIEQDFSPHAIDGIKLGGAFGLLDCIRAPAFYELARQPFQKTSLAGLADCQELSKLDLRKLLHLQRKLSQAWDEIIPLLDVGGAKGPECCEKRHVPSFQTLIDVKKQYPFDPILGIRQLKSIDWAAKRYCKLAVASLNDDLRKKSRQIWTDIPVWIEEIENTPESDSSDDESSDESTAGDGEDKVFIQESIID